MSKTIRIIQAAAVAAGLCVVTVGLPREAVAAGFALLEQSAEGTGFAYAGATAGYEDGSAIFFNPGAMGVSKKTTISAGVSMISPNAEFSNQGSHANPLLGGAPLSGDDGPNGGVTAWVPNFYAVHPVDEDLTLGFGVNTPFGLSTDYSDNWVGRYSAVTTELMTLTMSPAVSYQVAEGLSLGAALNVMYAEAKLTNAVDFGTIGVSQLGLPAAAALGLLPQSADGMAKVTGDSWGVGATVGASYSYCGGSRIGIAYRSQVNQHLEGDAEFDVPANAEILTSRGSFVNTGGKADLTLPDSISVGWLHELDDEWAFLADGQWTHWAHFDELRVSFDSAQSDSVVDEGWDNAWRGSVGLQYKPLEDLKLRAGFTYDQEPISDKYHRTPRIPGNDRWWMALGASYNFTEALRADLAYAHLFVNDSKTEVSDATGNTIIGEWDASIDIVSAQLSWAF